MRFCRGDKNQSSCHNNMKNAQALSQACSYDLQGQGLDIIATGNGLGLINNNLQN